MLQIKTMAATAAATFLPSTICGIRNRHAPQFRTFLGVPKQQRDAFVKRKSSSKHRAVVVAVTQGSAESSNKSEEKIPSWAKPDSEEPPPWARDEASASSSQQGFEIPFYVYLLASALTAIAAVTNLFPPYLHCILDCMLILLLLLLLLLCCSYFSFGT